MSNSNMRVRPRISGILRILLHKQEPLDAEQEFIKRAEVYPPPSSTLVPQGREDVLGWDQLVEASSKGGRMGAALPGPIRPAFQQFVRLSGQLAGEEGAVDGTTSTLYYLLTTASTGDGDSSAKEEFERLTQSKVDPKLWTQAKQLATSLYEWHEGQQVGNKGRGDIGLGIAEAKEFGLDLDFRDRTGGLDDLDSSDEEDDDEDDEEEDLDQHACHGMDGLDDQWEGPPVESGPSTSATTTGPVNGRVLYYRCEEHVSRAQSIFSPEDLGAAILDVLNKAGNDEAEIQMRLFELLGETGFEFMQWIFASRHLLMRVKPKDIRPQGSLLPTDQPRAPQPRGPSVGASVIVQTAQEKQLAKELRKEQRRAARRRESAEGQQDDGDVDWLAILGFDPTYLEEERLLGLQKGGLGRSGGDSGVRGYGGMHGFLDHRGGLPPGATKEVKQGYEEVHVPPPPKARSLSASQMVDISSLEPWAQLAFQGIKRLNRIQSVVFEAAYKTQENLLVCAPTGAGKTNTAMLALLALVREHMRGDLVDKTNLKAIYIAPMKALAQEVVTKFSERLKDLKLVVRELTGDMQLTKAEIEDSQLIVTTPEKWDVVTRKGGEGSLVTMVGLVIIDEVHLLADERGAVIESIVARTQRLVETSQKRIRLVGLSATLPNYKDVALFLRVNPSRGLFYFGPEFRPVPLDQTFIGVTEKQKLRQQSIMNDMAYTKALASIRKGNQVMIFVHSRKDTTRTAEAVRMKAMKESTLGEFLCLTSPSFARFKPQVDKSRNNDLRQHFEYGFGIHHAGMLRPDRSLTERMFEEGALKVLVCTATLAWGINLPAHTVIIKGTEVYNPEKGAFTDLSMLDVLQIFGRAGRPQYDTSGEAIMITTHVALPRYLNLLMEQMPIESNFIKQLPDHLNAEVVSGTVTNVKEAVAWLSYTYLYIRMLKNPLLYGMTSEERDNDPGLTKKRTDLINQAAKTLDEFRMVRFDPRSGNLAVTDMGRNCSHYYIRHESVSVFNEQLFAHMTEAEALHALCSAKEFEEVKVRPEELKEIEDLRNKYCPMDVIGPVEESAGKANVLLQAYISQGKLSGFTVISDTNYVAQNAGRICRALFEVALRKGWCSVATTFLKICKSVERRTWWYHSPLRQFGSLSYEVVRHLEDRGGTSIGQLLDMSAKEIGDMVHHSRMGKVVLDLARKLPYLEMDAAIQPITRGILRVTVTIRAAFEWQDRWHGTVEPWWIWVEDAENERVYHSEYWLLHKKQREDEHVVAFTIPIFEPLPPQYFLRAVSDRWSGSETVVPLSFKHLILPDRYPPHTDLLDLGPLPKAALHDERFESLYPFQFFNPIQTQLFHAVYHTDVNILVGAPTGSGKTLIAELAILRLLRTQPKSKTVYIAPLKALARERLHEWRRKLGDKLGLLVLELSGDVTPDLTALKRADIIIATPEKWDGITRSWKKRDYVSAVQLLIIDEIHLLGEDRGPVLEVIVSRMRYIASQTSRPVRMMGLSTALANPKDLADWLGVDRTGLYNFRPSVRPIPMDVHVQGFPGRHYCPRMATMNKPTFQAIMEHSPSKPALVFVSSRRQTRLTALELISLCAAQDNPKQFLHMPEDEVVAMAETLRDSALRHTLVFGIGIHHAGLDDHDRVTVEELFVTGKIQVLVCTSTLAWGVNFPAHLVVIKGTEYFDGKVSRYVDFPVTDILQMMGRAGRPQFDTKGVASIFVHEPKKNFIMKFLYEPFPVESHLKSVLHNHINAEIAGGAIKSKQDAVEYLTWTFFFRRLVMNPTYYHLEDTTPEGIQRYLLDLVDATLEDLRIAECITIQDDFLVAPTILGYIASYYYLDYRTVGMMRSSLVENPEPDHEALAMLLSEAQEYDELPVRHNEDILNTQLAETLPWQTVGMDMESAHTKAYLLLQAHFEQARLPITDYINDTKSVLDQAPRILNAMVDIAADEGLLQAALTAMQLSQMVVNACTSTSSSLYQLPSLDDESIRAIQGGGQIESLRDLMSLNEPQLRKLCERVRVNYGRVAGDLRRVSIVTATTMRVVTEGDGQEVPRQADGAFVVDADGDYVLEISMSCVSGVGGGLNSGKKKGGKQQGEGAWWVTLGSDDGELLALKRFMAPRSGRRNDGGRRGAQGGHGANPSVNTTTTTVKLMFAAPVEPGPSELLLFVVSDSLRGLDEQLSIPLMTLATEGVQQEHPTVTA